MPLYPWIMLLIQIIFNHDHFNCIHYNKTLEAVEVLNNLKKEPRIKTLASFVTFGQTEKSTEEKNNTRALTGTKRFQGKTINLPVKQVHE